MLIIISNPTAVEGELQTICELFNEGLELLQLHKPSFSDKETKAYLDQIPVRYHHKISMHSQYLKFHSMEELNACSTEYVYAFLSPVFDSISKKGYKSSYDLEKVRTFLCKCNRRVIALGGVDEDKVEVLKKTGFSGIALLGAIWQSDEPISKFKRIKDKWVK